MVDKIFCANFIPEVKIVGIKALPEALDCRDVGGNVGPACHKFPPICYNVDVFTELLLKAAG